MISSKVKDITSERFGRLVVVEYTGTLQSKGRNALWRCLCDCGNETIVASSHLRTGSTKSCGCLAKEQSAIRIKKLHNSGKHLYFVQCGEYVKIGRTDDVDHKLAQLKAANPYPIHLLGVLYDNGGLEKDIHELYKEFHHHGEWFKL